MRVWSVALIILTCAVLFGCRKSEEKADQPVVTVAPHAEKVKEDTRPVIVVFGDSLSEMGVDSGQSFPDVLQQMLDRQGYRYRVANLGFSGDTTSGGLGRIQSAIELRPELVILELGGNDGLRGIPVSSSKANLEAMIQSLNRAGIRTVLAGMTLPPNYGAEYIRAFEKMYRDLAGQYHLTLIPFLLVDVWTHIKEHPEWMNKDGIHPTAAGNKVVADTVMRTIEPLLKKG
jgi:acyl-CoA thioesterase-1